MTTTPLPKPEDVLTQYEKWKYWFLTNRVSIGKVLTSASVVCRVMLHFEAHTELADLLKDLADLWILGSSGILVAGKTQPDSYHEERKQEIIRERSGAFPPFDPGKAA